VKAPPIDYHFFKDVDSFFIEKYNIFIEDYLGDCILGGDSLNFSSLDEISFAHINDLDSNYCVRILNSIINSEPLIKIHSTSFYSSDIYLDIFYLNNYADIEDFYCVKRSLDSSTEGFSLTQILEVQVKSLSMINDFWLTNDADLLEW
jgi:hypothetical protein